MHSGLLAISAGVTACESQGASIVKIFMSLPRYVTPARPLGPILFFAELSLAVGGVLFAQWQGISILGQFSWSPAIAWRTAAGLVPMVAALAWAMRSRWGPLVDLRERVVGMVGETLGDLPLWELALISAAAGVGEEVLFRGGLQPWLLRSLSPPVGIAIVAAVFGMLHAATATYFVFATVVGAYLGAIAHMTGELWSPILIHAGYDLAALAWAQRRWRQLTTPSPGDPSRDDGLDSDDLGP